MPARFPYLATAALLCLLLASMVPSAVATEAAWARIQSGGYTILLQAGETPGAAAQPGDDECSGRVLSDRGHQLAQKLGARFAARSIRIEKLLTSSSCAARETARLSFGSVAAEVLPSLDTGADQQQTEALRAAINTFQGKGNLVIMTDRNHIAALTGITPRPSEAVVVAPAKDGQTINVAGRIIFD